MATISPFFLLLVLTLFHDVTSATCESTAQQTINENYLSLAKKFTDAEITWKRCADFVSTDDGWIMVFRGTAGLGTPTYEAWGNSDQTDDFPLSPDLPPGCTSVDGSLACDRHFRSRLLNSWSSLNIDQVKIGLYQKGEEKKFVTFDGQGSTSTDWLAQDRLVDSSWPDLQTNTDFNFFCMNCLRETAQRRFYISKLHNGCPGDVGWLTVSDTTHSESDDPCPWTDFDESPSFLYAPGDSATTWQTEGGLEKADVFAVFVKLS